ncbi:unnamed protein product [Mesocestoides corti]|uniref:Mre11 DNA-binding domain-containing protein n=1 Tax=Mesocestoides corti TaxID=53468 RepID=A0A0R3U5R6_MESCO|nr:unnamed protein product [Mesocestoides corti]
MAGFQLRLDGDAVQFRGFTSGVLVQCQQITSTSKFDLPVTRHANEYEGWLTKLPLRSVRPFIFEDIVLQDELPDVDVNSSDANRRVEEFCAARIEAALKQVAGQRVKSEEAVCADGEAPRFLPPPEPLIRLRVDVSGGFSKFSSLRFGQKFVGRVANPKDLVTFTTRRDTSIKRASITQSGDSSQNHTTRPGLSVADVESVVSRILTTNDKLRLELFTDDELAAGLRQFVAKGDGDGIDAVVAKVTALAQSHLYRHRCGADRISSEVVRFARSRKKAAAGSVEETPALESIKPIKNSASPTAFEQSQGKTSTAVDVEMMAQKSPDAISLSSDEAEVKTEEQILLDCISDVSDDEFHAPSTKTALASQTSRTTTCGKGGRGRGRGVRSRGTRGSRARGRALSQASTVSTCASFTLDSDESNDATEVTLDLTCKHGRLA